MEMEHQTVPEETTEVRAALLPALSDWIDWEPERIACTDHRRTPTLKSANGIINSAGFGATAFVKAGCFRTDRSARRGIMIKSKLEAGKLAANHNATFVSDTGKSLKVRTRIRAGQPQPPPDTPHSHK
jgi:hypothetical protein